MTLQVQLTLKRIPEIPVEAETINPETVAGKEEKEIKGLSVLVGKYPEPVGDWFNVELKEIPEITAVKQPLDLLIKGDLTRFKRIGEGMSSGRMHIDGSVGFHAGAKMKGGELVINGDAGDYLGAHMKAGTIVVNGNTGHYSAAAYRGSIKGMTGGKIIVTGNAGQMLGARMRRGLVYVAGNCGDVPGFNMKAGTIIVGGTPGARVGARMVRGSIMLLKKNSLPELLPTFTYNCTYMPSFWGITREILSKMGFMPEAGSDAIFQRYSGDTNEGGKGEVLVSA